MCSTYGYVCQYPADEGPAATFADPPHHVDGRPSNSSEREGFSAPHRRPNSLQKEKERSRSPEPADRGLLDPVKGRYMSLHSAVAFPRSLGLHLQSLNPPHLHSFAWNCGIRTEASSSPHEDLRNIITRDDFDRLLVVYFDTVHPIYGILDRGIFMESVERFWNQPLINEFGTKTTAFNAVLAGVLALGSFFSASQGHHQEGRFVAHAKDLLEDPNYYRLSSINLVTAQVLRTLYLRATTRPHASWLSSCTAVHLAEATGIHREIDSVVLTSEQIINESNESPEFLNNNGKRRASWEFGRQRGGCEIIRRLFWSAWAVNKMISYEYGRSCVILTRITTKLPKETEGDFTYWHIRLAMMIPGAYPSVDQHPAFGSGPINTAAALMKSFDQLEQIPDTHPYLTLSKADLALCIYRRLRLLSPSSSSLSSSTHNLVNRIITIGNLALEAALEFTTQRRFWWQVLCTTFQYICVLLAIDTPASLSQIQKAIETLDEICTVLGSHVAMEASNTAKVLLRDAMRKKRGELEVLEKAVGVGGGLGEDANAMTDVDAGLGGGEEAWSWDVGDVDWDRLLDPGTTVSTNTILYPGNIHSR